ncbi:phage tail tape measure protein [Corynebacterium striatum]|uniref:phage tail tape measure protein n=1 Tax=Corynebacterium striatum TaxID=43770 RepID=UPI003B5AD5BB
MADNALGWVSVPFVPTFEGITQRIEKGLVKPAEAASKKASGAVQKTADDMVKSLERQAAASKKKVDDLGKAAESAAGKEEVARQKVQAAIAKQKAAEEDYQKALAKGDSGIKELAKLEDAKAKIADANVKLKKAEQDTAAAQKKAKDQAEDYAKTVGKLEDAQKSAKDEEDRHKGVMGGLRKEMDKAKAAADEAGTSFHDIGAKLKTGMTVAAGAVAGGLAGLVKVGTTFDNTWDTVRAGTGATGEAFEALKENIRNVAKESVGIGGDFEAIGSTAADLNTRLGLTGKPLEDMTRSMMQLQELGVDADINSLSQAMNGFGVEAEDMPAMLDKMFQVSQATGLSVSELANSAVKAGPSLRGFGFDMADSAALVGQMDKAGLDADKTLQSMQRALAEFASEGRDAPEALKETIGSIEELINAGDEAAAIDMASNIFGTRGAAQFVDAVKTGTLSVDDFMAATGATSDTINGVAEETANFAEKWDQFKLNALAALEPVASKIFDSIAPAMQLVIDKVMPLAAAFAEQLGPVLEDVVGKLTSLGEWILKNKDYLVPLLVAVGTAIGLWKAWALGMTAVTTALKLAKAAQEGMNLAMKANVIGIVVTAIAALVAGLVWFFTKTETGRELWEKFTRALGDGWDWVVDKLSAGWEWLNEKVFRPLAAFFTETLWPTIESVLTWVSDKWKAMLDAVTAVWGWLRDNVLVPLASFFTDTLWPAISSALGWVSDKWNWLYGILSSVVSWIWDNVIMRSINGYVNLWNRAQEVIGWLVDKWNWMRDMLHAGWTWIDENVFAPLGRGLDTVKGWFQTAVDAIGRIWDGIKEKTKAPVQFVVDVVYNGGIRKAWNAVAGLVGLDKLKEIKFATGGILPGYTPGRDPYTFIEPRTGMRIGLSGGEAIVRPEATRVLGSAWVDGVNAAARVGGEKGVADFLYKDQDKSLGHFYSGGVIGSITDWVHKYYPMMTITSTLRNTNDYHGQGLAVDFSNGTDTTPQMQSAAQNLFSNYGRGLLELIHSPFSHNVKHGKDVGDGFGFYGAGTMNGHRNHVHVASQQPLGDPKNMVEMVWDGAKAVFRSIKERVTGLFTPIIDKVKGKIGGFNAPGVIGDLPQAFFETVWGKAKEFILGKADEAASYSGAAGSAGSAESWREMAVAAMRRQGFNADDPAQVNAMLAQIMSESGGDPGIAQQIVDINGTGESAGVGLLQIIPGTFAAHRDPELPDDRRDPWANMNASLRYYKSRYGTDLTTMWGHGHGYASGGIVELPKLYDAGGWLPHGGSAVNLSGKPEPVFTAGQWNDLASLIRGVGDLVPAIKAQTEQAAKMVESTQEWMAKVADPSSVEGINLRSGIHKVLDLGLDLPGEEVISSILDGEKTLWDSRERAIGHVEALKEKEEALLKAKEELAKLESEQATGGPSEDLQKKIDEAQAKLEEAKADQAKAASEEERAKAADKVKEAEENLKKTREDVASAAEDDAKKRAESITKANESVKKAESDLAEARKAQAQDLDNIVLVSQDSMAGLAGQARGLANQLIGMGAPAGAVQAGLAGVTSALSQVAGMAGPAGLTLGMVMDALKAAVNIVKTIVDFIKGIIERIRKARIEAYKALSDGLAVIADYAKIIHDMQVNIAELQQSIVRGLMAQRTAEFNLKVAAQDRLIAEAEGHLKVAEARMKLDEEVRKGALAAQLKLMGLHEDWDTYMAFQALQSKGVLEKWSDAAISALFEYEKARAEALKGELQARVDYINAEAKLAEATRQNLRNQQDLVTAQERLIRMSAKVAGVDLEDATGMSQIAKLMAEISEASAKADKNVLGKIGAFFGAKGPNASAYRGQLNRVESLKGVLRTLIKETGANIDMGKVDRVLKKAASGGFWGQDPMDVLRNELPELVAAESALKTNEYLKPIYDIRDQKRELERKAEDLKAEIDVYEKVTPLEKTIKGLEYAIKGLGEKAQAWAKGNEKLRGDYLRSAEANEKAAEDLGVSWKLDPKYANGAVREQIRREITIHMDGEKMYTADQVDKLLAEVTAGTSTRVRVVRPASLVASTKRGEVI